MLTLDSIIAATKQDIAYGGDGSCRHQFGGPEPVRRVIKREPESIGPGVWIRIHNPQTGLWDRHLTPYTGEIPASP